MIFAKKNNSFSLAIILDVVLDVDNAKNNSVGISTDRAVYPPGGVSTASQTDITLVSQSIANLMNYSRL